MSKEKKEPNPFDAFDILKGDFVPPIADDDIIAGDDAIINDEPGDLTEADEKIKAEKAALEKGNKALEKVIEIQSGKAKSEDEESEDEDEIEEDTNKSNGYLDAIRDLSEKGVLEIDADGIEDSEEGFEKAIKETVENRIKNHIASFGEGALDFLAYVENGGDPKKFISIYYNDHSWKDFDLESEANQKTVIRESLKADGYEPDEIEDMITEFEDNGTLEKRAKPHKAKLEKKEESDKAQLVEAQRIRSEEEKAANKKVWDDFKADLDKKDSIKGFKLTPKLKENIWKHITMIDKATGKTAYQLSLEKDKDAQILFALQSMNNFDISKLETQVETKMASKVSGILKNYKPTTKDKISGGRSHVDTEGDDPFALFGK